MQDYPNTYPIHKEQKNERPNVFDPALKHFGRAFRLGDPISLEPEIRHQWLNARQQVIDHLLRLINGSLWNYHLVLRGSLLLKSWLGDVAREPGDIDWVFRPENIGIQNSLAGQLFDELIQMVSDHPHTGNVTIDIAKISMDNIWTYERADGRRIVFPWKVQGLPPGELQMDVVFGEELFAEAIETSIPSVDGGSVLIWSVTKELSLAWKLLWLATDSYPQGKDLYDATLLAEQTQLPFDLLYQVLQSSPDWKRQASKSNFSWQSGFPWVMDEEYVDWDNFKLEYPGVEGEAKYWQNRLSLALAPTFTNVSYKLD
jgi:hypothetical protein